MPPGGSETVKTETAALVNIREHGPVIASGSVDASGGLYGSRAAAGRLFP